MRQHDTKLKIKHKMTFAMQLVNAFSRQSGIFRYFKEEYGFYMVIFGHKRKIREAAYGLFTRIVEQARDPEFYVNWQVADTLDGRFDLIVLHVSLVVNRLGKSDPDKNTALLTRYLQESLFDNMDMSLRELGVGDMSVGKKVKIMAEAYYGRLAAYKGALGDDSLGPVLIRNIYREKGPDAATLDQFISYIRRQADCLDRQTDEDIMTGDLIFEDVI